MKFTVFKASTFFVLAACTVADDHISLRGAELASELVSDLYDKGGEENLGTSGGASCKGAGMNCVKNADCCNNKCNTFPAPPGTKSNCNNGGLCGQCAWSDSPFENRGAELASELVNDYDKGGDENLGTSGGASCVGKNQWCGKASCCAGLKCEYYSQMCL